MDPLYISLVSACTALVASIVAPFVTLAVAKRQFAASVLSANRQRWIESLRDTLAELVSLLVAALVVKANWKDKWDKGLPAIAADPKRMEKLQRIVNVQWKVRLLLNPSEPDHQELYRAIEAAFEIVRGEETNEAATNAHIETITRLGQAILKREWQRVKSGT